MLPVLLGTGALGGWTTLSTYANQSRSLLADGQTTLAATYMAATLVACVLAVRLGHHWSTAAAQQEFEIEEHGKVVFRKAPGDRGTEVIVETTKKTDQIKADLRKVKQLIEVGEIVRSDAAPEGAKGPGRSLTQKPATPLKQKQLEKVGGKN